MRTQHQLQLRYQKLSRQKHKQDTRRKIQMGELMIQAKLDHYHEMNKEILLGILVDAANQLEKKQQQSLEQHYANLGKKAYENSSTF